LHDPIYFACDLAAIKEASERADPDADAAIGKPGLDLGKRDAVAFFVLPRRSDN